MDDVLKNVLESVLRRVDAVLPFMSVVAGIAISFIAVLVYEGGAIPVLMAPATIATVPI